MLVARVLEKPQSWCHAHPEAALDVHLQGRIEELVFERENGQPIAYLLGAREFYGRDFSVDSAVLIPRPETEHLVETALDLRLPRAARVVDVGTGSGCIILTLAAERPEWRCTGVDTSAEALATAEQNRARHGLARVDLVRGDLLTPLNGPLDLVVSNPPYVADNDPHLAEGDVRFEPREALVAGADGLDLIRRLVRQAAERLAPGGWLLIEHGYDQADAVRALMTDAGFDSVRSVLDLAGIERVSVGTIAS